MTTHVKLEAMETVKEAWEKQKGAKGTIWGVLIVLIIIRIVISALDDVVNRDIISNTGLEILIGLVAFLLGIIAMLFNWGLVHIGIKRAVDQSIAFSDIKHVFDWMIFFKMIGYYILQILVMIIPIALCLSPFYIPLLFGADTTLSMVISYILIAVGVISGVYLAVRMFIGIGLILFGGKGPWMALKLSFRVTKDNVLSLLGLTIVNFFIIIISAIPLGIGLIWTLPYALINYGVVYKKLYDDVKASH